MANVVRNILTIVSAWCLTCLGLALAGYILATSGVFGEIAHESSATGTPAMDAIASRATSKPGFADKVWRTLESGQRVINWIYIPGLAVVLGTLLGLGVRGHVAAPIALGLLPFAAFLLTSDLATGLVHSGLAIGVASAVMLWQRRRART
jgi:hypothetical protein